MGGSRDGGDDDMYPGFEYASTIVTLYDIGVRRAHGKKWENVRGRLETAQNSLCKLVHSVDG